MWRFAADGQATSWLERSGGRHADASQLCMMCAQLAGECVEGLIRTLYYYQKEINVEVSSAVVTNDGSTIR